jgi:hypothetical protein
MDLQSPDPGRKFCRYVLTYEALFTDDDTGRTNDHQKEVR